MSPPEILYLVTFPLVGAAIGWCTNFLAIKMLFHPRKPLRLPGLRIQGLLPRRQGDLAEKIGETVADEILSAAEISSLLGRIHWREEVEGIVASIIGRDLVPRSMQMLPGVSLLLQQVQDRLTDRILEALDSHMDAIVARFHDELDIKAMVVEKIAGLDLADLEKLVFRLVARELRHIELVGGILGFVVGLVQSLIFFLSRN
jgi:uncharacterized membrane protein YheB (UPF0754 family)